jgi:hypothetical protein
MMNNSSISNNQTASSYSAIPLLMISCLSCVPINYDPQLNQQLYPFYSVGNDSSYDSYSNCLTRNFQYDFNDELSSFYTRLATSQQRLGVKFEKVLFDNLWDLYEN